ncbi:MAG: Fe-S cluster assembly protein SufD [Acidobacteriota bacterium]
MSSPHTGADAARAIARAGGEPEWLERWRLAGWETYASQPLPDRVSHLWRYTEPAKFLTSKVSPVVPSGSGASGGASDDGPKAFAAAASESSPPGLAAERSEELAGLLIQEDTTTATVELGRKWKEAGVILSDLPTAVQLHPDLVEQYLGKTVPSEQGKFAGLNAALFNGGVFLYVPAGVELDLPVSTLFRSSQDLSAVFPRTLLVLEEGAAATLIDEYGTSPRAAGNGAAPRVIAHAVVEGHVGRNANLQYVNVQNWGCRTRSHYTQRLHVDRDGSVVSVGIGLGGLYNKADIGTELQGANANSEMIGVLFGDGRQHFDNHTEHIHVHSHTFSDLDFKVVLEDRSRSAYTGLIRIELDATNSEAYQENRNLLLDSECRAESIPELEILNQEVRCTHGATIGPIDDEQVFYLMTRGLSRREAERAIVEGFFAPVMDRIGDATLKERLWSYIRAKLQARR